MITTYPTSKKWAKGLKKRHLGVLFSGTWMYRPEKETPNYF
jgi:hypothetical protein